MSERDYLAKEEALRRLSEPEGDHELHAALERMRESYRHLWEALHRVHLSHDADPSKLEEWRKAPEDSQEQIWASWRCRSSRTARARRQAPLLLRLPLVFLGGPGHLRRAMPRR